MSRKPGYALFLPAVLILILPLLVIVLCSAAAAANINCLKCHRKLTKGRSVHPALAMGCPACHTGIDAGAVPHKKTNNLARGLSSDQPELCYGCHDQAMFTRKDVHPAIGMGCTACHDPHSSKNAKLLKSKPPDLCFSCHDKAAFAAGKTVHPPVASGDCLICHAPHSSDEMALLLKKPVEVCLSCHGNITHWPHFSSPGGTGENVQAPEPQDPLRPGKPFYCGSCHDPHRSDAPHLLRFVVRSGKDLCLHCHRG